MLCLQPPQYIRVVAPKFMHIISDLAALLVVIWTWPSQRCLSKISDFVFDVSIHEKICVRKFSFLSKWYHCGFCKLILNHTDLHHCAVIRWPFCISRLGGFRICLWLLWQYRIHILFCNGSAIRLHIRDEMTPTRGVPRVVLMDFYYDPGSCW